MTGDIAEGLRALIPAERLFFDEPMSRHTSFKIGGPADILADIASEEEAVAVLRLCRDKNVSCLVMGNGTNLLVRDGGIRGVVIKLQKYFSGFRADGETVWAQSGVLLSRLSRYCAAKGLTGLEFACGIPGTVGGAVIINAGAYGGEIKDVLVSARIIENGEIVEKTVTPEKMGYRSSIFSDNGSIVLSATFRLTQCESSQCFERIRELMCRRNERQPVDVPSAGSVFKRPANGYASELIDKAGLKGERVGGAEVSTKHAGFIVNTGGATARDVLALMEKVRSRVFEAFGVELESEIRIAGCD